MAADVARFRDLVAVVGSPTIVWWWLMAESGGWYGTFESSDAVCGPGGVSCGYGGCGSGTCVVRSSAGIGAKAAVVGSHSKTSRTWTLLSAPSGISLSALLFSACKRVIWSMFGLMMISLEAS